MGIKRVSSKLRKAYKKYGSYILVPAVLGGVLLSDITPVSAMNVGTKKEEKKSNRISYATIEDIFTHKQYVFPKSTLNIYSKAKHNTVDFDIFSKNNMAEHRVFLFTTIANSYALPSTYPAVSTRNITPTIHVVDYTIFAKEKKSIPSMGITPKHISQVVAEVYIPHQKKITNVKNTHNAGHNTQVYSTQNAIKYKSEEVNPTQYVAQKNNAITEIHGYTKARNATRSSSPVTYATPRALSSDYAPADPTRDNKDVQLNTGSPFQQDDNGRAWNQQSYGGFSGLVAWTNYRGVHTIGPNDIYWLVGNYYGNSDIGDTTEIYVRLGEFFQGFTSRNNVKSRVYLEIFSNTRGQIALYTGRIVARGQISWNGGWHYAIRGVADPSGRTSEGIDVTMTDGTVLHGGIQGTPNNDSIVIESGTINSSNRFSQEYGFISLGNGNDTFRFTGSGTVSITNPGELYMGAGNDSIEFSLNNTFKLGTSGNGIISAGDGNDTMRITGLSTANTGHVYMGAGNDFVYYGGQGFNSGNIYLGSGNDSMEIHATAPGNITVDSGSGNNTISMFSVTNANNIRLHIGNGNSSININNVAYGHDIDFGVGNHSIRLQNAGGTYNPNRLTIPANTTVGLYSTAGTANIANYTNNGLLDISMGNTARFEGTTTVLGGTTYVHFYDGASLTKNFETGDGDDSFHFLRTNTTRNLTAGRGNNTMLIDSATVGGMFASGNDEVTVRGSQIDRLDLLTQGATRNLHFENIRVMSTDGIQTNTGTHTDVVIRGTLNFVANSKFILNNGTYDILIDSANVYAGAITAIDVATPGTTTVNITGTTRLGDIHIRNGVSTVIFDNAQTTNFGTLNTSGHSDYIEFINASVFRGTAHVHSSPNQDTIRIHNSTIAPGADFRYTDKLYVLGEGNAEIQSNLRATNTLHVLMKDDSDIIGDVVVETSNLVHLHTQDDSAVNRIRLDQTRRIDLKIFAEHRSSFTADLLAGGHNDSMEIDLLNQVRYTGRIDAGAGNDTISISSLSTNVTLTELRMGDGNDSLIIRPSELRGGTQIRLGIGNNTVDMIGNVLLTEHLNVYETANATTRVNMRSNAVLTGNILTGQVPGDVRFEANSTVKGMIQAFDRLNLEMVNGTVVEGNVVVSDGDSSIRLTSALIEGSLENNRGARVDATIQNSTIEGDITGVGAVGSNIIANNSEVQGTVRMSNLTLQSNSATFGADILAQGNSEVTVVRGSVTRDIVLTTGTVVATLNTSTIGGGVNLTDGEVTATFSATEIAGNVSIARSTVSLTSLNSTIGGDINIAPSGVTNVQNTIRLEDGEVKGSLLFATNADTNRINITRTQIANNIDIGIGINTIEATNAHIAGNILFRGETTSTFRNTQVDGTLDFTSATLLDQNLTIIGSTWDAINLGNVTNIVDIQDARIRDVGGFSFRGNAQVDNVTFTNTTLGGKIDLGASNDTLTMENSTVHGGIDMSVGDNMLVFSNSGSSGDIFAQTISIRNDSSFTLVAPVTRITGTKTPRAALEFSLGKAGEMASITLEEDATLHITPNSVGDTVNIYGNLYNKGGAFIIDVDFVTKEHDTIIIKTGTKVRENPQILKVNPTNVFTGSEVMPEVIEGVLISEANNAFERIPKIQNIYAPVGGYLYELSQDAVTANKFNLILAGEDPLNYGYAAMGLSSKNYTRTFLETLDERNLVTLLSSPEDRKGYGVKNARENVSFWVNTNISSNTIDSPLSPDVTDMLSITMGGVDIKELDLFGRDRFAFRAFGSYGTSQAKYSYDMWEFTGEMKAISFGGQASWENLRSKQFRMFLRATAWVDMFTNELYNAITFSPEKWSTMSTNASIAVGGTVRAGGFRLIPEIEILYTSHSGTEFISANNSKIEIKDATQMLAKLQGTAGYSTSFGLTPYIRVGLEVPFGSKGEDSGVYVAGRQYNYDAESTITRLGVGASYAISILGLDISAFADGAIHVGKETGYRGNVGVAIGF